MARFRGDRIGFGCRSGGNRGYRLAAAVVLVKAAALVLLLFVSGWLLLAAILSGLWQFVSLLWGALT